MGGYNELTDPGLCENQSRRSPSSGRLVQSLSAVPNWVALAGGMALGKMLGRSSGLSSSSEGSDRDISMDGDHKTEGIISCGPWGGVGGTPFYDGSGDIVEIHVNHSAERILCIETSYNEGAASFKATPHGTSTGGHTTKITLQYPEEYLVQVKGTADTCATIDGAVVTSVTFVTNKQVYGPYRKESGVTFASLPGGKVVGFVGRSGTSLDQLGVLISPDTDSGAGAGTASSTTANSRSGHHIATAAVAGPWGGRGGAPFHDGHGRVVEIMITYHKHRINSLQVSYEHGAFTFKGSLRGVPAGNETKITLRSPDEFLIQLKGTSHLVNGVEEVASLTFITNHNIYGPYGSTTGRSFESTLGKIVGFYGRFESSLHQIGVITEHSPENHLRSSFGRTIVGAFNGAAAEEHILSSAHNGAGSTNVQNGDLGASSHNNNTTTKVRERRVEQHWDNGISPERSQLKVIQDIVQIRNLSRRQDDGTRVHGPWGGWGGDTFCDGRGEIVEIVITFDAKQVISLQVSYAHDESTLKGSINGGHGASGGSTAKVFEHIL